MLTSFDIQTVSLLVPYFFVNDYRVLCPPIIIHEHYSPISYHSRATGDTLAMRWICQERHGLRQVETWLVAGLKDIPAKRKSRSEASDLIQIAKFVTTNSISIFVAIWLYTYYSLFPAFAFSPFQLLY